MVLKWTVVKMKLERGQRGDDGGGGGGGGLYTHRIGFSTVAIFTARQWQHRRHRQRLGPTAQLSQTSNPTSTPHHHTIKKKFKKKPPQIGINKCHTHTLQKDAMPSPPPSTPQNTKLKKNYKQDSIY